MNYEQSSDFFFFDKFCDIGDTIFRPFRRPIAKDVIYYILHFRQLIVSLHWLFGEKIENPFLCADELEPKG